MSRSLKHLARRAAAQLEHASAETVLRWAATAFAPRLALTSSMTDAVLLDLVARAAPGTDVLFLDTGYHFPETLAMRDEVAERYGSRLTIRTIRPADSVDQQDAREGPQLYLRDADRCCYLRKVAPLDAALADYDAWASGLRRDDSPARAGTPVVQWDSRNGMIKVNPLAGWTRRDIDAYIERHSVLTNPLLHVGYSSIGCAPCTSLPVGEDSRSGRWVGRGKTECGIHLAVR